MRLYQNTVLRHPLITLGLIAMVTIFFLAHINEFELDASADSLILENDAALNDYREIREQYGSDDFLIVTYSPKTALFNMDTLADIRQLGTALRRIEGVKSVLSLLDVPLISSPPTTLMEISKQVRTLESKDVDIELAAKEMTSSPLYENLLVSSDASTTALQVNLSQNTTLIQLQKERQTLLQQQPLLTENREHIKTLSNEIRQLTLQQNKQQDQIIAEIREVMSKHQTNATLFLGGVPMIVSDSISYIRSDLKVFGVGVIGFIIIILAVSFASLRWVVLPLTVCLLSALIMIGYLGWMQWPVTVVSSNFISLLLIITLSLVIHLIVRYREVNRLQSRISQSELVNETMRSKFTPCVYTAVTTMVAFGSLLVSGIRPVIDFGWMMVIGIILSFILAFTLFPAVLMLMKQPEQRPSMGLTQNMMNMLSAFIHRNSNLTLLLFIVLSGIGLSGLPQLSVDNRFIDYYKDDTEIYQGMSLIDNKLGGTTPMDIVINAPKDDFSEENGDITVSSYWFNRDGLRDVAKIHNYLESLPEIGKVLSVNTGMQLLETLNGGKSYSDFKLAVVYKRLPSDIKQVLIDPYLSIDGNQLRFSLRIYESNQSLQRQALLDKIQKYLTTELGLSPEQVHLSGMVVLYNNLLQSLFQSQIVTLGAVFIAILIMFIILFQNVKLSIVTLTPNMIAAGLILGLMGWANIPLDIMTITIAAISIGIGVDDSIHYVHRFREEFALDGNHWAAIKRSHASIGHALYYTTITVVLGFSILSLSNFIPTIYFGLLSGLAMTTALLANLMLLPVLIAKFKLH